jgi:Peptidase M76 family
MVRFMRDQINELGVDIPRDRVVCLPCTNPTNQGVTGGLSNKPKASGGIDPNYGIVLCGNLVNSRKDKEDALTHEMVHMYDYVRFKFDRTSAKHMACTEVGRMSSSYDAANCSDTSFNAEWRVSTLSRILETRHVQILGRRSKVSPHSWVSRLCQAESYTFNNEWHGRQRSQRSIKNCR